MLSGPPQMTKAAKRRSTTRVGRDHPRPKRPAAGNHASPAPATYRATAPILLDGSLYRVLESTTTQRIVQEWTGSYWLPSLLPLYRVADAMMATREHLERNGVPATDWLPTPRPAWEPPTLTPLDVPFAAPRRAGTHGA